MPSDRQDEIPLVEIKTLTEVTVLSSGASFAIRAVSVTLRYPEVQGQREALARLAEHAADAAELVHRALKAAMDERDRKSGENP